MDLFLQGVPFRVPIVDPHPFFETSGGSRISMADPTALQSDPADAPERSGQAGVVLGGLVGVGLPSFQHGSGRFGGPQREVVFQNLVGKRVGVVEEYRQSNRSVWGLLRTESESVRPFAV